MKKILLVLLGLSIALVGCEFKVNNDDKKEKEEEIIEVDKEDLMDQLSDIDEDDFEDLMDELEYTEVDFSYMLIYINADFIKKDKIDFEDFEDSTSYDQEGELFIYTNNSGETEYIASTVKKVKGGYVRYTVYITSSEAALAIIFFDKDGSKEVYTSYIYDDGELEIDDEEFEIDDYEGDVDAYEDDLDYYKDLIDGYEKSAMKFFEKAFVELDSVIN